MSDAVLLKYCKNFDETNGILDAKQKDLYDLLVKTLGMERKNGAFHYRGLIDRLGYNARQLKVEMEEKKAKYNENRLWHEFRKKECDEECLAFAYQIPSGDSPAQTHEESGESSMKVANVLWVMCVL